jgi:hypothetical protein
MRVLNRTEQPGGYTDVVSVECDRNESLLAFDTDGFYEINGQVFSGHDVGVMRRVSWDSAAQEWKVPKP